MKRIGFYLVIVLFSSTSFAQNTGGVFSPIVNAGHKSIQYRAAVEPDNKAGEVGFAQRFHYQEAINGDFMWRLIGQSRKTDVTDFDFDYVQAELFWDLSEDKQRYHTGLRFDARLRDGERANQIGVNWINQYKLGNNWYGRAVLLTSTQVGENSVNGMHLETRWQLAKRIQGGQSLGIEMYNTFGNTRDFGDFDEQSHTIGPIFVSPLIPGWSLFTGALFGVSDAAPDSEFRFWLTRKL